MSIKKKFSFWCYDKDFRLVDLLAQKVNVSEFVKDILTKEMKGELIPRTDEDLKREKIRVDIEFKKVCTLIKQKELAHWNTFGITPSNQGKTAIKRGVENSIQSISCYDEKNNRIQCPQCGSCFVHGVERRDIGNAKEKFMNHYFEKHNDILPVAIIEELNQI